MKRIAIALLAGLALTALAKAQILGTTLPCNQSFQVSQAAATAKVATANASGVGNKIITWCGWAVNAGAAAGTAQLQQGTGTNCGTSNSVITPAYSLGINGVLVDHGSFGVFSLSPNADLCLVTTGTGPMQVEVFFTIN